MRVEDFFAEPGRQASDEIFLGSGWTTPEDPGADYAVYWIKRTGDLYGLRHAEIGFGPGAPKWFGVYLPRFSKQDERRELMWFGRVGPESIGRIVEDAKVLEDQTLEWLRSRLDSRP